MFHLKWPSWLKIKEYLYFVLRNTVRIVVCSMPTLSLWILSPIFVEVMAWGRCREISQGKELGANRREIRQLPIGDTLFLCGFWPKDAPDGHQANLICLSSLVISIFRICRRLSWFSEVSVGRGGNRRSLRIRGSWELTFTNQTTQKCIPNKDI